MDSRPEEPVYPTDVVDNPLPPSVPYASVPLLVGDEYTVPLSCAINPTKDFIACGTETGVLLIYRTFSMQLVRALKVDESAVYTLIWAPDSQSIIVVTIDSIVWVSLARDTSVTKVVGGESIFIPGTAVKGGSNEYLSMSRGAKAESVEEAQGDIIEAWRLESQDLSVLSHSISTWLIEIDPVSLHYTKFGSKDFCYRSCFRVIGVELLIIVALNYYEAVGLKSITFLANRCGDPSPATDSWTTVEEVDYTDTLASALNMTSIPPTSDVLAITGHVFVVSTGLKYVIFRRNTLFTPYTFVGKIEYTPQMLIQELRYIGDVAERRFEAHKQTLHTNEEPTIAITFSLAKQLNNNPNSDSDNIRADTYEALRAIAAIPKQGEGNKVYIAKFRSFHHFFLFIYAYHASLYKANITDGGSRFYQALTDLNFQSLFSCAATAAREGDTFEKLIGTLSFTFSADICDFSAILCDELIASFTLMEVSNICKDSIELPRIDIYMTSIFNLADIFKALGNDVMKYAPDLHLLYPNPSLAALLLNYRTISFKTSIDKQWLYLANARQILTLSVTHNVCEVHEYGENFLISDLVFDMRPLSSIQVELGYAPYELVMASVGYSPPYTLENSRLLSSNYNKTAVKQANVIYADFASLSHINDKIANKNNIRKSKLTILGRQRKKIAGRKRNVLSSIDTSSKNRDFKSKKTSRRKLQACSEVSTVNTLTNEELSTTILDSNLTTNQNEHETGPQEGSLTVTASDISALQRILLQVEPQVIFWACREVQDFNSCFPGFETVSTNVLYIEREDELDIDQSHLYPQTALPRAIDVDYRKLQCPTKIVQDDDLNILSWEDSIPSHHYLLSYTDVHKLPIKLTMTIM